jgi:uncharacterized protein (DUF58 family)
MLLGLILLQAAAPPPDIELNIRATARSVEIQQKGKASLEVRAGPDAGSRVRTEVNPPADGAISLKNVTVEVHAEARIKNPQQNPSEAETSRPD